MESIEEFARGAVEFCSRLVRVKSLSGAEGDAVALVAAEMKALGYHEVEIDAVGNVVGTIFAPDSKDGRSVLFDGHIDTVGATDEAAWSVDPFGGAIVDGKVFGRGTSDMKGSIAAMVYAAGYLARAGLAGGAVHVSASVSEEVLEGAALAFILEQYHPDIVVIGESTGLALDLGQRGRTEIVIETHGVAAHSSTPDLGICAVEKMADIITALRGLDMKSDPLLGKGVLVLTDIISTPYPATSLVPHVCRATFDRRTLVGETSPGAVSQVNAVIERLASCDPQMRARACIADADYLSYTGKRLAGPKVLSSWKTPETSEEALVAKEALAEAGLPAPVKAYSFCTNGSGSAAMGITTIGFGPGFEGQAHAKDEFIEVDQIMKATQGFIALGRSLSRSSRQMRLF